MSAPLPYSQAVDGCLSAAIGKHGLDQKQLSKYLAEAGKACEWLRDRQKDGALALLQIVDDHADIAAAESALATLSKDARTLVFFGTGGSSLGGQTLAQLGGWNVPGHMDGGQRKRPRTRFYDNLDPETLGMALSSLDLVSTRFIVTSKSGGTVETLVQVIAALQAVKAAGLTDRIPRLFLGLTEPATPGRTNGLRDLLEAHRVPILDHHTGIGGRFSVLSNVGLLPALARGLNARALRQGAATVVQQLVTAKAPDDVPAALGAAIAIGLNKECGVGCQVMMPYADRLGQFAAWFVQLWAESLGKSGEGTSPIACLGPLDQHSQLQLFQDGPHDHLMTILRVPTVGQGPKLDAGMAKMAGISFLANRAAGDLVAAQAAAVPHALSQAGRPVRTFDLPRLDEHTIGALLMHFMLETIIAGRMLGIDPFDQPAVELAKTLARERLTAVR